MSITSHLFLLVFLPAVCVTWRLANRHSSCAARLCLLAAGILFCGWSAPWSLLALPGALLLLACPNPTRQAQRFRPAWWKALLAAAALIWSLVSLVGVETFIYANF